MPEFEIGLITQHGGTPRDEQAHDALASALPDDATVSDTDGDGVFSATVEADDLDEALTIVWDAVAASGTDDHLLFLEHADLPEHWRSKTASPGDLPGSL
jgi:hypothetical protein